MYHTKHLIEPNECFDASILFHYIHNGRYKKQNSLDSLAKGLVNEPLFQQWNKSKQFSTLNQFGKLMMVAYFV